MRLDEWLLKTVVFIGTAPGGTFVPSGGTGFIIVYEFGPVAFPLIVTAKHVIDKVAADHFYYRVNRKDGGSDPFRVYKSECAYHADSSVDLAVFPVKHGNDLYDTMRYKLDRKLHERWMVNYGGLALGDEVALVGLYTSHYGLEKNSPVVRFGNIAAIPSEPVLTKYGYHPGLLIEIRSTGGVSGSPVYKMIPPAIRLHGEVKLPPKNDYQPIGIFLGTHEIASPADGIQVEEYQEAGGKPRKGEGGLQLTPSGLGVVAPLEQVFSIVEGDKLKEAMKTAVAHHLKNSGFVAQSSPSEPASDSATDKNPTHREDFKRLLNVAAQKRKPSE